MNASGNGNSNNSSKPSVAPPPRRLDAPAGVAVNTGSAPVAATPALLPKPAPITIPECVVSNSMPDGSFHVTFYVAPNIASRLRKRAEGKDMGVYLWENLLHRALDAHVY